MAKQKTLRERFGSQRRRNGDRRLQKQRRKTTLPSQNDKRSKRSDRHTPARNSQRSRMQSASTTWMPGMTGRKQSEPAMPATARRRRRQQKLAPVRAPLIRARELILSPRWISLILFVMSAVALYKAANNPRFQLYDFEVLGVEYLADDYVIERSGLRGAHIFAIDPTIIETELEALPGVISAEVGIRWPDGVTIEVEEDTPLIVWQQAGEQFWVNQNGHLIPVFDQSFDLPKINAQIDRNSTLSEPSDPVLKAELLGIEAELADFDNTEAADNAVPLGIVQSAVDLQRAIAASQQLTITEFDLTDQGGLTYRDPGAWVAHLRNDPQLSGIDVQGGWEVRLGTGADAVRKISVYNALVAELLTRGIEPAYIDISNAERPFYLPQQQTENTTDAAEG